MDIKYKKIYAPIIIFCLGLTILLFSGCINYLPIEAEPIETDYDVSDTYIEYDYEYEDDYENDYDISDPYIETAEYNEKNNENTFFGIWRLDGLAFSYNRTFDPGLPDFNIYAMPINIKDFTGYEIEFRENFVRIGDERILYNPLYETSLELSWLSLDRLDDLAIYRTITSEITHFPLVVRRGTIGVQPEIAWVEGYETRTMVPGYFLDHKDMFERLGIDGVKKRVDISYPDIGPIRARGEDFDPWEFRYGNFRQNPLFHRFLVLDDEHILFQGENTDFWEFGGSIFMIATRIAY